MPIDPQRIGVTPVARLAGPLIMEHVADAGEVRP